MQMRLHRGTRVVPIFDRVVAEGTFLPPTCQFTSFVRSCTGVYHLSGLSRPDTEFGDLDSFLGRLTE
jgi:hypothetical protein